MKDVRTISYDSSIRTYIFKPRETISDILFLVNEFYFETHAFPNSMLHSVKFLSDFYKNDVCLLLKFYDYFIVYKLRQFTFGLLCLCKKYISFVVMKLEC